MKNDAQASVPKTKEKLLPLAVEVELGDVQFAQNPSLGIIFFNQIDAWRRMEIAFTHKIERPSIKRSHKEFTTFYYSLKES